MPGQALSDLAPGLYSAADFGVRGGGNVDDGARLTSAFAAVAALGGGTLLLGAGTYRLGTSPTFATAGVGLLVLPGVTFTGAGSLPSTTANNPVMDARAGLVTSSGAIAIGGLTGATTPARLAGGTNGAPPVSGTFQRGDVVFDNTGAAWICVTAGSPGIWYKVGDRVLLSAQAVIASTQPAFTFTVAQVYRNLTLELYGRTDENANISGVRLQMNGDTTGNYDYQTLSIVAAAATPTETIGDTSIAIGQISGASATVGAAGQIVVELANALAQGGNGMRTLTSRAFARGTAVGGQFHLLHVGGVYRGLGALTSLTVFPNTGNFVQGSTCCLYGDG